MPCSAWQLDLAHPVGLGEPLGAENRCGGKGHDSYNHARVDGDGVGFCLVNRWRRRFVMKHPLVPWLYSLVLAIGNACAEPTAYFAIYTTTEHGYAYGFAGSFTGPAARASHCGTSPWPPIRRAKRPGNHQWAFGRGVRGMGAAGIALDPGRARVGGYQRGARQRLSEDRESTR